MSAQRLRLRLGTRGSSLALWQARDVASRLGQLGTGVETVVLRNTGDRDTVRPIGELESYAPFADALEQALREGDIDLAVHSLKDLPLEPAPDLVVAAVPTRGAVGESLVSKDGRTLDALPSGARIGTSCLRRALQIQRLRRDLVPVPIRGAVEQRVRQVREGEFDAAVLATAGLVRLGLEHLIAESFDVLDLTPAPGQGALAVQVRAGDERVESVVAALDDVLLRAATDAELRLQRAFEPSSDFAVAAVARCDERGIALFARLLRLDGHGHHDTRAPGATPEEAAQAGAQRLRAALEAAAA